VPITVEGPLAACLGNERTRNSSSLSSTPTTAPRWRSARLSPISVDLDGPGAPEDQTTAPLVLEDENPLSGRQGHVVSWRVGARHLLEIPVACDAPRSEHGPPALPRSLPRATTPRSGRAPGSPRPRIGKARPPGDGPAGSRRLEAVRASRGSSSGSRTKTAHPQLYQEREMARHERLAVNASVEIFFAEPHHRFEQPPKKACSGALCRQVAQQRTSSRWPPSDLDAIVTPSTRCAGGSITGHSSRARQSWCRCIEPGSSPGHGHGRARATGIGDEATVRAGKGLHRLLTGAARASLAPGSASGCSSG